MVKESFELLVLKEFFENPVSPLTMSLVNVQPLRTNMNPDSPDFWAGRGHLQTEDTFDGRGKSVRKAKRVGQGKSESASGAKVWAGRKE